MTVTAETFAALGAMVVIVSAGVSAIAWLIVRPSEDKVRQIVKEEMSKFKDDLAELKRDVKDLLRR